MMPVVLSSEGSTLPNQMIAAGSGPSARACLMIFGQLSSSVQVLPDEGVVFIGRGEDAHVRIVDPSISRCHARLSLTAKECWLSDEDSQNGTCVNGSPVRGPRCLLTGDVITIGAATLLFYRPPVERGLELCDLPAFRARFAAEIDRCVRYHRRLSLLCLAFHSGHPPAGLVGLVSAQLRAMDAATWDDGEALLLLLPERTPAEGTAIGEELLRAITQDEPAARAGLAACPDDASDVDTLIAGARAASRQAAAGQVLPVAQTAATLTLGEGAVILAEPALVHGYDRLKRCAASTVPLLLIGETGTGKLTAARVLHSQSSRAGQAFVSLNCAALVTSAEAEFVAAMEAAEGGTLYLKDVGELPPALQARLSWTLEGRGRASLPQRGGDIRLLCSSQSDLKDEVARRRFRQDLYFALAGAQLVLPPLRERLRELPLLATEFLRVACLRLERPSMQIQPDVMHLLRTYPWPGNLRELRSVMEGIAATSAEDAVQPGHLPVAVAGRGAGLAPPPGEAPAAAAALASVDPVAAPDQVEASAARHASLPPRKFTPLSEELRGLERRRMEEALAVTGGVLAHAAILLSMSDKTFRDKAKEYGLRSRAGRASRPSGPPGAPREVDDEADPASERKSA